MPNSSKLLNLNDIHPVSEKRINMGLGLFLRWAWLKRESGLWNRCSGAAFFKVVVASPSNYAALFSTCCSRSGFSSTVPIG
ncbi:hypothetical protein, partial [Pseudomonas syringae]|uniref:hypothetical protein n=1 Tax=Pseudomonas syringae TaxID=317 RepID=UPI001C3F1568